MWPGVSASSIYHGVIGLAETCLAGCQCLQVFIMGLEALPFESKLYDGLAVRCGSWHVRSGCLCGAATLSSTEAFGVHAMRYAHALGAA